MTSLGDVDHIYYVVVNESIPPTNRHGFLLMKNRRILEIALGLLMKIPHSLKHPHGFFQCLSSIPRRIGRLFDRLYHIGRASFCHRTERDRDERRSLDFHTIIQPEEVGLDSTVAYRSSPSGNVFLRRVLDDFNITKSDCIVDIGCGKGSAMRTMLEYPFAKVDGVQLSEYIASIAKKNFEKLNAMLCTVFAGDAALFRDLDI